MVWSLLFLFISLFRSQYLQAYIPATLYPTTLPHPFYIFPVFLVSEQYGSTVLNNLNPQIRVRTVHDSSFAP